MSPHSPPHLWKTLAAVWSATVAIFWHLPPPRELLKRARLLSKGIHIMFNLQTLLQDAEIAISEVAKAVAIVSVIHSTADKDTKAGKVVDLMKEGLDILPIPASARAILEDPRLDRFIAGELLLVAEALTGKEPEAPVDPAPIPPVEQPAETPVQ